MIFQDYNSAYEYASDHAEAFEVIQLLHDKTFNVLLEGEPDIAPGVISEVRPCLPDGLEHIEQALAKVGDPNLPPALKPWPPMSDFWRKVVARAYFFGKPEVVCRVGRRGGKSSTMCRVAVYEALLGDHKDSAGERAYFAIISAEKGQAKERLIMCSRILAVLGIECKPTQELIDLPAVNRGIRVFTASVQGVVSFTCIGAMCDEEAYWKDKDSGANPAPQVLANLRPTTATQPNAKIWHISAPYSVFDTHYEAFEKGTNQFQTVFFAESWVANPSLSIERTKLLEPDEPTWLCQYAAIPMPSEEDAFFPSDLVDAARQVRCSLDASTLRRVAGGDFAFRRNSSALVCLMAGEEAVDRNLRLRLLVDREWVPVEKSLKPSEVLLEAIEIAEGLKCESLCCDLHYIETVREALEDTSLTLSEYPSSRNSEAYVRFRVLLSQGKIDLSKASDKLIKQLKATKSRPTPTGLSIENPEVKGAHGDLVSALICSCYEADTLGLGNGEVVGGKRRFAYEDTGFGDWVEHSDDYDVDETD